MSLCYPEQCKKYIKTGEGNLSTYGLSRDSTTPTLIETSVFPTLRLLRSDVSMVLFDAKKRILWRHMTVGCLLNIKVFISPWDRVAV